MCVAGSFIGVTYYLYQEPSDHMKDRPLVQASFIKRKSMLSRIGFWAQETNNPTNIFLFSESYDFRNPLDELDHEIKLYQAEVKKLFDENFQAILSALLKERIFRAIETDVSVLKHGIITATNSIILDAYSYAHKIDEENFLGKLLMKGLAIQNELEIDYKLVDEASKWQIYDHHYIDLVYVIVSYCFFLLLLLLFFYLPFINKQKRLLRKMKTLLTIIECKQP